MAQDYAEHKKRFDFPNDGHWNRDAQAIVVDSLFSHFKTEIIKTDYFPEPIRNYFFGLQKVNEISHCS